MSTKTLVPRASGEGGLGATDNAWGQAYYDTGNFNKGLFVSGKNIDEIIADAVTGGGLGGVWNTAPGGIIYYNGGNVGIGTTSPGAELTVTGTVRASKIEALTDTGFSAMFLKTNEQPAIKFTGTPSLNYSLGLKSIDAGNNSFELNLIGDTGLLTSNLLTIKSNGNVGIGTATPASALDLGSGSSGGRQLSWHSDATTSYSNIWSSRNDARTTIGNGMKGSSTINSGFESSVSISWAKSAISLGSGSIFFYNDVADTVPYGTPYAPTESMRLNSHGNLFIGDIASDNRYAFYRYLEVGGFSIQGIKETTAKLDQNYISSNHFTDINGAHRHKGDGWANQFGMSQGDFSFLTSSSENTLGANQLLTWNEIMRISSAGKVIIGTDTNNPPASPAMSIKGSNGISGQLTVDQNAFYIGQNDANRELRLWSGQFTIGAKLVNGSNSFVPFSCDRRSKENIAPLENVLDKVLKLSPSRYDYKEEYGSKDQIGFIAQEVNEVLPEFYIPGSTEDKMSTVKFSDNATTALLVKAIQEQQQLIEDLRSEVEALKNK